MANLIVNSVFSANEASPLAGKTNLADGMLSTDGMVPMGAGLHEPVVICFPLVMGRFGTVRQKLMKLLVDVREATWPFVTGWMSSDLEAIIKIITCGRDV